MDKLLRRDSDGTVPNAPDFSETLFDEIRERVAGRARRAVESAVRPAPGRRPPTDWSALGTAEDWKAYHAGRPEWRGLSARRLHAVEGGAAFYKAFSVWCRKESAGDEPKRKALMESVFPAKRNDWSSLGTVEDWKAYRDARPEWAGLSTAVLLSAEGGYAFYDAFRVFCVRESGGDEEARKRLSETLFPPRYRSWDDLETVEDWKAFHASRPEWAGLSTGGILSAEGGAAFYGAFSCWCRKRAAGDEAKRRELVREVFPPVDRWTSFRTLEDWKAHHAEHPEWHGLSITELFAAEGGRAFYKAFLKWCNAEAAGDGARRLALTRSIFPPRGRNRWRFGD